MTDLKNPKKILHVTFDMGIGGTEQVIRQLVGNLDPKRYHCEIACIDGKIGPIGETLASEGVQLHSRRRQSGLDWGLIRWLRNLIREGKFDIVHCHQYTPYSYGWFAHWGTGAKLVFTEHGRFYPDRYRYKAMLLNPVMALTTRHVVAISQATRSALARYEFMPRPKIRVIYNGINGLTNDRQTAAELRRELGIQPGTHVIGTVARLDGVKNQALMVRATRQLLDQGLKVVLLLVGDGPERDNLTRLTKKSALESNVIFTGFQNQPAAYLSLMDVFLLPSFTEGTSMTLLEAMSLGIPSVVSDVGGNPEIITDGETGRVIPSDDLDAFTGAITELLANPDIRSNLGAVARESFMSDFSVTSMGTAYQALYDQR